MEMILSKKQITILTSLAALYVAWRMYRKLSGGKVPKQQSVIVDQGDVEHGIGPTYRHRLCKNGLVQYLEHDPSLKTVWDIFTSMCSKYPKNHLYGKRLIDQQGNAGDFQWTSYEETLKQVKQFASGLVNKSLLGMDYENQFKLLGLFAPNSPEWNIAEYACMSQSSTTLPLYTTLTREEIIYILVQTACQTVVCSEDTANRLIDASSEIKTLKHIVHVSVPSIELIEKAKSKGITIHPFAEVMESGKNKPQPTIPPKPSDIFSFCYTSGSTGPCKGALLSHANMVADIAGIVHSLNEGKTEDQKLQYGSESYLSYLPSAHQMERTVQAAVMSFGSKIGFFQGDPKKIMADVACLRPTVFCSVPRLLNRLHDAIMSGALSAGGIKAKLFTMALESKREGLREGHIRHPLWDTLVFKKVQKKIGLDRCKTIITGSAPIAGPVLDNLRIFFSCVVLEGYGQTEATCASHVTYGQHFSNSHVGPCIISCECRLVSVPDTIYSVKDTTHGSGASQIRVLGRGEVCLRGPIVMQGYYRMKEKTAETIDKDGWLHTGDVGCWLENGTLKIVDRAKNIFKLAQGEFVAPEKIENTCIQAKLVAQAFVHGTTMNSFLVAVIVPDFEVLLPHLQSMKVELEGSTDKEKMSAACKNQMVIDMITKEIQDICRKNNLHGYEIPKYVYLNDYPFDPSNGILTATSKMQRTKAVAVFKEQLSKMYERGGEKF